MLPLFDSRKELEGARQRLTQALVELDRRRLRALSGGSVDAGSAVGSGWGKAAGVPQRTSQPAVPRAEPSAGAQSLAERLRAWFAAGRRR